MDEVQTNQRRAADMEISWDSTKKVKGEPREHRERHELIRGSMKVNIA
jgi:hypothetical protein